MGENSAIEWTDHTFNPWQGCIKVSPGCQHCYAEALSKRWGRDVWGPGPKRQRTSAANWQKPIQWNRRAEKEERRFKVFCASMADVFEDNPQVEDWRSDLWDLIELTPNLDWLLLTKRPENIRRFTKRWDTWEQLPANIRLGTSVENQEQADKRIPELLRIPASVRFLSIEPLLGPVSLWGWLNNPTLAADYDRDLPLLDWVIVGGESGHSARPMHLNWVRSLRDQCQAAGIPFFFKQWGEFCPPENVPDLCTEQNTFIVYPDGRFVLEDYRPLLFRSLMSKVGKKAAGRLLDGQIWNQFPTELSESN